MPTLPVEGYDQTTQPETGLTGAVDRLFGLNGQPRYQTWPEKMVRDAISAPATVTQANPYPEGSEEAQWFENQRQGAMVTGANSMASLAGTGVLAAEKGALGSAGGKLVQPTDAAPRFYSALEKQVADSSQSKMSGDQWLGTLGNKAGVKPEEIQAHLNDNKVELGETLKGLPKTIEQRIEEYKNKGLDDSKAEEMAYADHDATNWQEPRYAEYQVPGGESYRELLMTLPDKGKAPIKTDDPFANLANGLKNNEDNYHSSHWDEPNILAHMRMNDRTIDGKKSLHLEEVQSDWHQDGRKKGYVDPDKPYEVFDPTTSEVKSKYATEAEAKNAIAGTKLDYSKSQGVPDAPFKKSWHELALKRAIAEAAENGYDKLSWTAGEHHPTNPKNLNQTGEAADAADRGMQGFYNNIVPKAVEKLTGQKVQKGQLNIDRDLKDKAGFYQYARENGMPDRTDRELDRLWLSGDPMAQKYLETKKPVDVYHIDIPQSLRERIVGIGQPLFSAPPVLIPVNHDPFKTTPVDSDPFQ